MSKHLEMSDKIAFNWAVEYEIEKVCQEIQSVRTASAEHQDLVQKWARPEIVRAVLKEALFDRIKDWGSKAWDFISERAVGAWENVRGALAKFKELFKFPELLKALTKTIGEVTPDNVKAALKKGKDVLMSFFRSIRAILVTPTGLPTVTDLVKRTQVGAGVAEWYEANVRPTADLVDAWIKEHSPTLRRVAIGAIFLFIWMNVDELSWELADLQKGFSGALSLSELIATFPESAIGAITGHLFGVGFVVMPVMIAARVVWLLRNDLLIWDGKELKPNPSKVDMEKFEDAENSEEWHAIDMPAR